MNQLRQQIEQSLWWCRACPIIAAGSASPNVTFFCHSVQYIRFLTFNPDAEGILRSAPRLRPPGPWYGYMSGEDLARSCLVCHAFKTMPLGYHQEERLLLFSSEHTCEAATVKMDRL